MLQQLTSRLPLPLQRHAGAVWRAVRRLSRPEVRIVAGGIAFYALFSIFPLIYLTLTLLIAILPSDISSQIAGSIQEILTTNVEALTPDEVDVIASLTPQGLTLRAILAVLVVGFTATSGAKAAITGIRMIAGTATQRRSLIRFQGISLLMTALLILLVWLLGAAQLVLGVLQRGDIGELGRWAAEIAALASSFWITKWIAGFAIFYLLIALSLRGHVESGRAMVAGAATGAAAWLAVTWGFQLYLRFSVLDTLYGALASVIIGFLWLVVSVMTLLLGAALTTEWSQMRRAADQPADA